MTEPQLVFTPAKLVQAAPYPAPPVLAVASNFWTISLQTKTKRTIPAQLAIRETMAIPAVAMTLPLSLPQTTMALLPLPLPLLPAAAKAMAIPGTAATARTTMAISELTAVAFKNLH